MQIFIHGTDKGNAVLLTLVLIIMLSAIFITVVPRVISLKQFSHEYKAQILRSIEQSNKEKEIQYDLY